VSDLVLAEKDPDVVLAEALAAFKAAYEALTGKDGTLAPADPRRLILQTFVSLLSQQRALIDFSGKQSLLRFVSDLWIDPLAELWFGDEGRLPATASVYTERFLFAASALHTIPAGVHVTDGTNIWEVIETTSATADHVDALVRCIVTGVASNGVANGQIDTLVDPDELPGCTGVTNTGQSVSARDAEGLEEFRARLRDAPENTSTAGPRLAYEALAKAASASVADAVCIGPEDGSEVVSYAPGAGEVFILVLKGTRDAGGVLTDVVPQPDPTLIDAVTAALSAEDVRPLADSVSVQAPVFRSIAVVATYYVARSRIDSVTDIQAAAQEAFDSWVIWQQAKIGRDINPSELIARLMNAGAKRVTVSQPAYAELLRDESAWITDQALNYGGVEDD
jgi:phage-related baseplate assembly protein